MSDVEDVDDVNDACSLTIPPGAQPAASPAAGALSAVDSETSSTTAMQNEITADDSVSQVGAPGAPRKVDKYYDGDVRLLESNTPTKSKQNSNVWKTIRRIPVDERDQFPGKTHVCTATLEDGVMCLELLKLTRVSVKKGSDTTDRCWQTGQANAHLRSHGNRTAAGQASLKRQADEMDRKMGTMFEQGMNQSALSRGTLTQYSLSHEERALSSQARWYIYSKMHVSKQEFESDEFREMLREQAGGRGIYLTRMQLKEWVRAEWSIFLIFLRTQTAGVRTT